MHGYHTLSSGKIFLKHPLTTDKKRRDALDHGEWALMNGFMKRWYKSKGKRFSLNGLPPAKGDRSYHSIGFDWAPTAGNDETKMKDYITAKWAVKQLKSWF